MSPLAGLFSLNPFLAAGGCTVICALRPVLRQAAPWLLPRLTPDVARDSVLHRWESIDGTLRNVLLSKSVALPLRTEGPKVVFVAGRLDCVTPLPEMRALSAEIGARLIETENDHNGYLTRSRDAVLRSIGEATDRSAGAAQPGPTGAH